jgi:hypothetical protein
MFTSSLSCQLSSYRAFLIHCHPHVQRLHPPPTPHPTSPFSQTLVLLMETFLYRQGKKKQIWLLYAGLSHTEYCQVLRMIIGWVWFGNWIHLALYHTTRHYTSQFLVTLVSVVSLPLLGSGVQQRKIPFLWVSNLSPWLRHTAKASLLYTHYRSLQHTPF